MKRKQEKLAADDVDIFYCSGMSAILRKSFASLDSLVLSYQEESTYSFIFKVHTSLGSFLEFIPISLELRKEQQKIFLKLSLNLSTQKITSKIFCAYCQTKIFIT